MKNDITLIKEAIASGKTSLGIELGSTRIKAVLIDENCLPIAQGGFNWENKLLDGIWTYDISDVWIGIQESFKELKENVLKTYGTKLLNISSIGISAMMHGYLIFDKNDNLLTPFRTWRNTMTEESSKVLTNIFKFNIPQRWSIAHLYQSIINDEPTVKEINFMTTLAGYVNWKLTGEKVIGICDASGIFPIDSEKENYHIDMIEKFTNLVKDKNYNWEILDILPKVLLAGENAGTLTKEGAKILDPSGELLFGSSFCPPEGDAGTGMVATNSVSKLTGNVSAGTSIFAMLVLEKELSNVYPEIDMVTTPHGKPVAMVHCNNFSSDIDAWVNLFRESVKAFGTKIDDDEIFQILFSKALESDLDCGGLLSYNYFSGEHITGFDEGRPLLVRTADSKFNIANLMRCLIFSSLATLKIGMDILFQKENVQLKKLMGHGGFFKTPIIGQKLMASGMDTAVSVMQLASEGGAWGIALLANFQNNTDKSQSLDDFLSTKVFHNNLEETILPDETIKESFEIFMDKYKKGLAIELSAINNFK